jgi:hypothetical protein
MSKCKGDGDCLNQTESGYESNQSCEHKCVPIQCPNYIVCKTILPQWVLHCHSGTCMHCNMMFGKWNNDNNKHILKSKDDTECPICLETKLCVSQPRCDHYTCVDCFRRCYYGVETSNQHDFPYSSDIENEYDTDPENPKWGDQYPLIKEWNALLNGILDDEERRYVEEKNLRQCPLCRK